MSRNAIGKEAFVHAVLELLDEGVSLRELNLRSIARHIGCAHTNAYNWFSSWEELLWYAMAEAIERLVRPWEQISIETMPSLGDRTNPFGSYIEYAITHPAWFRLIWLEPMSSPIPPTVAAILEKPSRLMLSWFTHHAKIHAEKPGFNTTVRMIHSYLHGELCLLVGRRIDHESAGREIFDHIILLCETLLANSCAPHAGGVS